MRESPPLDAPATSALGGVSLQTPSPIASKGSSLAVQNAVGAPTREPEAPAEPPPASRRRWLRGVASAAAAPKAASLYRVMWRWHFYAGLLVSPILFVTAVTGAIYVFKDEIEDLTHAKMRIVAPQGQPLPVARQLAAATAAFPGGEVEMFNLSSNPARSTRIQLLFPPAKPAESKPGEPKPGDGAAAAEKPAAPPARKAASKSGGEGPEGKVRKAVFVDPYTAEVLGSRTGEDGWFFELVLMIHRRLYAGDYGRLVVEFSTSWTLILLATGVYLWWPRKAKQSWGVWLPRLFAKPYVVLRDLHALPGALFSPVAAVVVFTGLFWTILWGSGFKYFQAPIPRGASASVASQGEKTFSPEAAAALGQAAWPDDYITVSPPNKPNGVYRIHARPRYGSTFSGQMEVDQYSGAVLSRVDAADLPILTRFRTWVYPLHVGSVFGLTTKIFAFVAALTLVAASVTGVWMWWQRRPAGRTGFPRTPVGSIPLWLWGTIAFSALFLPAVGISVVVFVLFEAIWNKLEARRTPAPRVEPISA